MLGDRSNPLARVHALWALVALDGLNAIILNGLMGDPHPGLREQALRAAAVVERADPKQQISTSILARLADDPAVRVRLQAALALGNRCGNDPVALAAMTRIAGRDGDDPWMRLALLSGLSESAVPFIRECQRIPTASARPQLLGQAAALVGVRRRPAELSALLGIIGSRLDQGQVKPGPGAPSDALTMVAGLAEGLERSGQSLHIMITSTPEDLRPQWDWLAAIWRAAAVVAVSDRSIAERLVAIDVLARGRPDLAEEVVPGLLLAAQPREIQSAAATAVGRAGRPSLAAKALDLWSDLPVATRRELLSVLAGSRVLVESLIKALERGMIAPGELDVSSREALERLPEAPLRQRASVVLSKFALPRRSDALARYQSALKLDGDVGRGMTVFARNCQTCHERQGQGHRVGPDLSGIAGRAPEALLTDILDPNREVAPDYVMLTLATRGGQVVSGLLAEETATTLKVRRAEGIEETVLRSQVDEVRSTGRSLMPEGLEQSIGPQEMVDLIAFLREGK